MKQQERRKTRKLLFQKLFSETFGKNENIDFLESFHNWTFNYEIDEKYFYEMEKIIFYREWFFIDIIKKYSPKFDFEKMSILNILPIYISLAEIFYFSEEIPLKVSINEAVELSKIFGLDSSKKIVNWVLNNIFKDYDELEKQKENYAWNNWFSVFKKS